MMEKQNLVYELWVLCILICLSSIIFVYGYILKKIKRRSKYNTLLPGMKTAWHDVLAGVRYLNLSQKSRQACSFQSSILKAFAGNAKLYQQEKLVCYWMAYHPMVFPLKAETAENMLRDPALQNKDFMYEHFTPFLGDGLITSSGDKWKSHRKLLNPCFHSKVLNDFIPILDTHARKLVKNLQNGNDDEIRLLNKPIFQCLLDVAFETTLGLNAEAEGIETEFVFDIFKSIKMIFMERALNWWMWLDLMFRFTKSCRIYNCNKNIADNFVNMSIIFVGKSFNQLLQLKMKQNVIKRPEEEMTKRKSVVEALLGCHMEAESISEEEIKGEINTFIAGGSETTTVGLIYALYLIGLHKDIQAIAHEEVDRIFGNDKKRPIEKEDLNEMTYVDCIIKETLRVYPPIPFFSRTVSKETNISDYSIPKGSSCTISPYILHRDPEVFPNPEKFDPTRFLPDNSKKRHPFAYIPFSAGPRNCIGQKFAMMAMKTIIANVLRYFSVESLDQRDKLNVGLDVTLASSIPLRFRLKRRTVGAVD